MYVSLSMRFLCLSLITYGAIHYREATPAEKAARQAAGYTASRDMARSRQICPILHLKLRQLRGIVACERKKRSCSTLPRSSSALPTKPRQLKQYDYVATSEFRFVRHF